MEADGSDAVVLAPDPSRSHAEVHRRLVGLEVVDAYDVQCQGLLERRELGNASVLGIVQGGQPGSALDHICMKAPALLHVLLEVGVAVAVLEATVAGLAMCVYP